MISDHIQNISFLEDINLVLPTSRNGLFFGFLFVAIGALIACKKKKESFKKSAVMFAFSMVGLTFEVVLLKYFDIVSEYDVFIFLIPAAYYFFYTGVNIRISFKISYNLRRLSVLIYFLHLLVESFIARLVQCGKLMFIAGNNSVYFISVLAVTICVSQIIILLSNYKYTKWLKKLYS